jgi:hypothetical protein
VVWGTGFGVRWTWVCSLPLPLINVKILSKKLKDSEYASRMAPGRGRF